ncbi:hypothetical protein [Oxalobacter paraformigenes]|uniref:hypothetical protein n=1 Tax=Oxalobacter paraformigenes TaxID=556268 RepID=UPI0011CB1292|nr:hypothetical protein [Oxalobacter paraformigenes]
MKEEQDMRAHHQSFTQPRQSRNGRQRQQAGQYARDYRYDLPKRASLYAPIAHTGFGHKQVSGIT